MIKKIGAILLALVLCMSVVVVPASAAVELGDAQIAFSLEWDKEYYSAGDTAVLSVYMDADDALSLYTGSFAIGLSSNVFDPTVHDTTTLRENGVTAEWFEAYYTPASGGLSQLASTVVPKVQSANTDAENADYDWYVKYTAGKNGSGWHDNTGTTKAGFGGDGFIADEPIIQIVLTVKDDVADGTAVKAAITSGTLTSKPVQTSWKYYKNPGNATTTATLAATTFSVSQAVAPEAVIGAACDHSDDKLTWTTTTPATYTAAGVETGTCSCGEYTTTRAIAMKTLVAGLKGQIRFDKAEDGTYAGSFDVRALAVIAGADFTAAFGSEADAKTMIKEIGFVFAKGSSVTAPDMAGVKALVENGTALDGYTKKTVGYLSTKISSGDYAFSCIVTDIPDAEKTNSLVAVGYVAWDSNADGTVDSYAYYPTAQTISFNDLYSKHYNSAFPA